MTSTQSKTPPFYEGAATKYIKWQRYRIIYQLLIVGLLQNRYDNDSSNRIQLLIISRMGNSKSQQYSSLIKARDPTLWTLLSHHDTHQLYQHNTTKKHYRAYPLNTSDTDSEQKLQLLLFRKLNHAHLVTIEELQSNTNLTCSQTANSLLFVENVAFRLDRCRQLLQFQETLIVLASAFCGYHILNYVYGPLYTSQEMICFNEAGVPKVWINQNIASSDPSNTAMGADSFAHNLNQHPKSLEQKTYACVQTIFDTVEQASTNGYPFDFKTELRDIRSFAEGQEFIDNYCRARSIDLQQTISIQKVTRAEPLTVQSENHSNRFTINHPQHNNIAMTGLPQTESQYRRHPSGNIIPSELVTSHHLTTVFPYRQHGNAMAGATLVRSTIANRSRIHFMFNPITADAQMIPTSMKPGQLEQNIPNNAKFNHIIQNNGSKAIQSDPVQQDRSQQPPIVNEVTQQRNKGLDKLIEIQSHQVIFHNALELPHSKDKHQLQSAEHNEPSKQEDETPILRFMHIFQEANIKSDSVFNSSRSQRQKEMTPTEQLQNWQKSLLILAQKQKSPPKNETTSEDELYQSEERDKVQLLSLKPDLDHFSSESAMETYIRHKYKEYFANTLHNEPAKPYKQDVIITEDEVKRINKEKEGNQSKKMGEETSKTSEEKQKRKTSLKEHRLNNKEQSSIYARDQISSRFKKPLTENHTLPEQKYSFGKIKIQPEQSYHQLEKQKIEQEQLETYLQPNSNTRLKHTNNKNFSKIEEKYEKYVKNKQPRMHTLNIRQVSSIAPKNEESLKMTVNDSYLLNDSFTADHKASQHDRSTERISRNHPQRMQHSAHPTLTYDQLRGLLWN